MESESKTITKLQTMLLLGAGASKPAGIPLISEMTDDYFKNWSDKQFSMSVRILTDGTREEVDPEDKKKSLTIISEITQDYFGKVDLEYLMSMILKLENEKDKALFEKKFPTVSSISDMALSLIKDEIQSYIREKCENIKTVDHLWTLDGLPHLGNLDIFTLNYDGTVEIFCEKNGVVYTDGFNPYWNPKIFAENTGVNLYKLHGSLYWFKTESGTAIKVPMKGLTTSNLKYLTDESVSEMMIYPAIQKDKESMIYSWISQTFKEHLNRFEVCIIIGYSFRDDDIKRNIIESITSNTKLWLVIVNPHASEYKRQEFSINDEISSRIIAMNMGMEEALTKRKLHSYLNTLEHVRHLEQEAWDGQKGTQNRLDYHWKNVLANNLTLEHDDRVKWLVEKLLAQNYNDVKNNFPEGIEVTVSPRSLFYSLEYKKQGDKKKTKFWAEIFCNVLTAIEHNWFLHTNKPKLQEFNPVKKDDLPYFATDSSGSTSLDTLMRKINDELKKIESDDGKINDYVSILIETFDFLLIKGRDYVRSNKSVEFIDDYKAEQLGLKEWASKICERLET